jgi:hypothetical protein
MNRRCSAPVDPERNGTWIEPNQVPESDYEWNLTVTVT